MSDEPGDDVIAFEETVSLALARTVLGPTPRPELKERVLASLTPGAPAAPGFKFHLAIHDDWMPHRVPDVRVKVLATNRRTGYATLLLDAAPGVRFPAHHHTGDEECYVITGSIETLGRRLGPGDFLHAEAGTDHPEMSTKTGARVLLVVPIEELSGTLIADRAQGA